MELLMRKSGRSWVPLWLNQTSEWDDQRHWFFQLQKISTEEDICKWWRLQQASLGWSPHLSWHNRLGHQHPPEAKPCKGDKSLKQEFRRWHKRMKKKKGSSSLYAYMLTINRRPPQLAIRSLKTFSRWRAYLFLPKETHSDHSQMEGFKNIIHLLEGISYADPVLFIQMMTVFQCLQGSKIWKIKSN